VKYRTGRKNGHTVYLQLGLEPAESDVFVGSTTSPTQARDIVAMANLGLLGLHGRMAALNGDRDGTS
jgi:hypothetical protein